MPINTSYRVLFFINGGEPTALQRSEALNFGPHVSFRNAQHIDEGGSLELCNAVYGDCVPKQYAKRYPWACSIVDYYNGKLDTVPMASESPAETDDGVKPMTAEDFDPFAPGAAAPQADWQKQG